MPSVTPSSATAMRLLGGVAVVIGGLVAAVTGPLELSKGSWAAAYLVLVAGVAQVAMGSAPQRWRQGDGKRRGWILLVLWNAGNIAVIGGTIAPSTPTVIAGALLLVAGLVLAFVATLRVPTGRRNGLLLPYRLLLVLLAVSIPVGVVLSSLRNA